MADEGQQSEDHVGLDKLLSELESLQTQLAEHQLSVAIMFADLKDSTAIFGELSDVDGLLALQRSESLIRPLVVSNGGTVIKTIGDAVMASFPSANEAVRASVDIQRAVERHNAAVETENRIALRMGVNVGKGYLKGQDVLGQVVNIAAKVQGAAEAGQILVSQVTVQGLEPELAKLAVEAGSLDLPGLTQVVKTYDILWREGAEPRVAPTAPEVKEAAEPHVVTIAGENPYTQNILGGQKIEISSFPFRVGRDPRVDKHTPRKMPENDLYLEDIQPFRISREHFQVELQDGNYFIRDRGSRLGLFVNGQGIGGEHPESVQQLVKGANLVVLGDPNSPYRFLITV